MNFATQVCDLCESVGGELILQDGKWRVILINDDKYPGSLRVVWNDHVKEMSDLSLADRQQLMRVVWEVESAVRDVMEPDKINLACLGNMTPHIHWHVIPRYRDDAHFPNPIWGEQLREPHSSDLQSRRALLDRLRQAIHECDMDKVEYMPLAESIS